MTRTEFIGAYNIGHRDGKVDVYRPNDYDDIFDIEPKTENKKEEPQQKIGHWIGHKGVIVYPNSEGNLTEFIACKCSECGEWLTGSDEYVCSGRFCPSCGAKMESEAKE